ncbi:DUF943 family protein [Cronobacter dublinensis subsp. dublinensis]|nr:DUF943 family protein [Cronobacter dublinensis subsp. dublinensis]EGT5737688.1 DUF943 family protein [Cronobacter dublinensis subsp. dublinensis]
MLVTASHLAQKGIAGEKICLFIIPVIIAAIFLLNYLNHDNVAIEGIHHGQFTAQILVNDLSLSSSAKIDWWIKNGKALAEKYSLNGKDISVDVWGDGYQEEGKADRLCFADIAPPRNCIDKNIMMSVSQTRSGNTEYRIDDDIYLQTADGKIQQTR